MIVVLVGHSGSGKSTVEKELMKRGIEKIVTYTTRPKRKNEIDDLDYYFVTNQEYEFLNSEGIFAEQNVYNNWKYGMSLKGINYKSKDYVIVLTPSGCQQLIKLIGREHMKIVYLCVSEWKRASRLINRGDDKKEVNRRIQSDRKDFKNLPFHTDFTFVHHEVDEVVEGIFSRINLLNKE